MLIEAFLDYLRLERNYSERTIVSYGTDLREFEEYLEETEAELDFTKVHADHVRNWISGLMDKGRTATSVNRKLSSLRSFYRFLLKKELVVVNPMLKIVGPKKEKPLPSTAMFVTISRCARLVTRRLLPSAGSMWSPISPAELPCGCKK